MTSPCERLTNFFNPFVSKSNDEPVDRSSRKRKFEDPKASSFVKRKFEDPKASSLNRIVQNTRFLIYNGSCQFPRLGSQVVGHGIGPFLADRDLVSFSNTNKGLCKQLDKILEIKQRSKFSSIPIFDKKKYKLYWGVEITDEFEPAKIDKRFLRIFLTKYFSPNPVDPTKLVKDTCLIPTVVPVRVMVEGRSFDYNLNLLGDIARRPGIGENAATYGDARLALEQHGETSPQEAYLQIVLVDVTGRNEPWERQVQRLQDLNKETGYGCETELDDVLGLVMEAFAEQVARGNFPFGDDRGMEGRWTFSRTMKLIHLGQKAQRILVGGFHTGGSPWREGPAELSVCEDFRSNHEESIGVAIQWKCGPSELES